MAYRIRILPEERVLTVPAGSNLLDVLRRAGRFVDAPCGGHGKCGKCLVLVDGSRQRACSFSVDRDITVELPGRGEDPAGIRGNAATDEKCVIALDIGTTTVVCRLLTPQGQALATQSATNPQTAWGADVVSRIRQACGGQRQALTQAIRQCAQELIEQCCRRAGVHPACVATVSLVGNSCMQQLFFGMEVDNLASPPFAPLITEANRVPAASCLPCCSQADILILPDIAGFVGADTLGCILAAGLQNAADTVLLVDVGTNGELVLCHRGRMAACATAAGPALEGAEISCGMRAVAGAVDHVTMDGYSCIGQTAPAGICGSGLIDAVAVMLRKGVLNSRGRICGPVDTYTPAPGVVLTQADIRQVQLAKGAIAAGIELLARHLNVNTENIHRCILCGAFGSHIAPENACRMGLLPQSLEGKVIAMGNLALEGAAMLALDPGLLTECAGIAAGVESLELGSMREFAKSFAKNMTFREDGWLCCARDCGFSEAVYLDPATLRPMEMVRAACAEDKCRAYGKNWTCPPHCGTLAQCAEKLRGYRRGILVQTVGRLEKTIDTKGYARTEAAHLAAFHALARKLREKYPDALCLGAGGCRICESCAWPAPCRFPGEACASMEAYGLFVTQVCRDNGLAYHHGEKTVTYTACFLF